MIITRKQLRHILKEEINESDCYDKDVDEIIRKLSKGKYRVYSKKENPKTGNKRNLGTFSSRAAAEDREKDIIFFKHKG
jgi:hypothetical protein